MVKMYALFSYTILGFGNNCVAARSYAFFGAWLRLRTFLFYDERIDTMLKPCAECGKKVSTNAAACPHCGNQPKDRCMHCIDYCPGTACDPHHKPEHCTSPHGGCPAFVYDDPSSLPLMKKLKRKVYSYEERMAVDDY